MTVRLALSASLSAIGRTAAATILVTMAIVTSACSGGEPIPASGKIAIVSVGDELVTETGGWPWPRSMQARLLDRLTDAGVKRTTLYFDLSSSALDPMGDRALIAALVRAGDRTILPALPAASTGFRDLQPIAQLRAHARIACDSTKPDSDGTIFTMGPTCSIAGTTIPSLAAALAGRQPRNATEGFWRYDVASVPIISAKQILSGQVPRSALAGRTVVVAPTGDLARDWTSGPDGRRLPSVYVPVLAAEELMREGGL